ncbi:hypothetical protein M407DRAFT_27338 [Tulasnella calospora MUT 4182]|uniref:Uncharacterized protein n=1 Tax=Tulasnella calospora MUT 4182 TaxID=1051891 RepID=A0A0C3LP32_9AGAM|nr:hypothetical protein M407DRAFT_27338 [Tulasnella calospora MUT 4182]
MEESIESFDPLLQEVHKKSGGSKLCAWPHYVDWMSRTEPGSGEHSSSRFRIQANSNSFVSLIRWVERVADSVDPEGLEVEIHISDRNALQDAEATSVLRRLRSVTKVHVYPGDRHSREAVRLLYGHLDHDPIPALLSLKVLHVIHEDVIPEEMLHMILTRFAAHRNHQEGGGPRKLPDLEIIADTPREAWLIPIKSFDFAVITQIRSIAGVTFTWNRPGVSWWESGMLAVV